MYKTEIQPHDYQVDRVVQYTCKALAWTQYVYTVALKMFVSVSI